MLDDGWGTELTRSCVVARAPPASMRGGALVGAFDRRERSREANVFMSEWTDIVVVSYVGASESPSGSCQLSQNPGAKREWRGRPTAVFMNTLT